MRWTTQASRRVSLRCAAAALAAGLASPALAGDAAPAATRFESFASPYPLNSGGTNVVCYIGNLGTKTVNVKGFGLRLIAGPLGATSNTCPAVDSFALKPGQSCGIGAATDQGTACLAMADDASALRGSLEIRDANGAVLRTARMTPGFNGSQPLASPPMFQSSGQDSAVCLFLNAGTATAMLSGVRLVTSSGQSVSTNSKCYDANLTETTAGRLLPGGLCFYQADAIPVSDIQCLANATHRSDVRGSFFVEDDKAYSAKSLR